MRFTVKKYDAEGHEFLCVKDDGSEIIVDPFVGCAISMSEEDRESGLGFSFVGRRFEIPNDTQIYKPTYLPDEFQWSEIF